MLVIRECYTKTQNGMCYTFSYVDDINVDVQMQEKWTDI